MSMSSLPSYLATPALAASLLALLAVVFASAASAAVWTESESWNESGGEVLSVAVAPDGLSIVTGAADGTVRIRNIATGRSSVLLGHMSSVNDVAYDPEGVFVVSASKDRTLRIWDVGTRRMRRELRGTRTAATAVAVDSKRNVIVSGGSDNVVRFFDAVSGRRLREYSVRGRQGLVCDLLVDAGGDMVLVSGGPFDATSLRIHGVNIETAAYMNERYVVAEGEAAAGMIAASADGRTFALGGSAGVLSLWAPGIAARRSTGHVGPINGVAVTPDGQLAATAGQDQTVRIWDVASGAKVAQLLGHSKSVNGVAFAPDGSWLVSVSSDRTARLWRPGAAVVEGSGTVSETVDGALAESTAQTQPPSPGPVEAPARQDAESKLERFREEFVPTESDPLDAGVVRFQEGRYVEAILYLERATMEHPEAGAPYGLLAIALWNAGLAEQASAAVGRATQLGLDISVPRSVRIYRAEEARSKEFLRSAFSARIAREFDKALADCAQALLRTPQNRNARELGVAVFDSMLESASGGKDALLERRQAWTDLGVGYTLLQEGDYQAAISQLQTATRRDDSLIEAHKWLACAAVSSGQERLARDALTRALELEPDLALATPLAAVALPLLGELRAQSGSVEAGKPEQEGMVYVAANRAEATAQTGSLPAASTPALYTLSPGVYSIRVRAEHHEPYSETITVEDGQTHVVRAVLVHQTQLRVTSPQAGVTIRVKPLGRSESAPMFIGDIPHGPYELTASRKGYKSGNRSIALKQNVLTEVDIRLMPRSNVTLAMLSTVPGLGQYYAGRSKLSALFLLGTVGTAAAAAAVHYTYYTAAAADYDEAYGRYTQARSLPEIRGAWEDAGSRYDEVNRWSGLRRAAAVAAGALWTANILHSLVAGPVKAPPSELGAAPRVSGAETARQRTLVVPQLYADATGLALHGTF